MVDTLTAQVAFISPAFLGGADSNVELRSAPFKGMLRYWWRILYSAKYKNTLKQKEAEIFGSTAETGKTGGKSSVLLNVYEKDMKVSMPLFDKQKFTYINRNRRNRSINTADYLAYGHRNNVIQPGSSFAITITVRKAYSQEVFLSFLAMVQYGGIGSKCRNGFGSMYLLKCKVNEKVDAVSLAPELWYIYDKPTGFSALSKMSRLYKTKYAAQCWEDAFVVIAKIYIDKVRRCIAKYEKQELSVAKNSRLPKFLLLSVTKENNGFFGQILALPINFDYIVKDKNAAYSKMVDDVYKNLDGAAELEDKTAFLLGGRHGMR